MRTLTLRPAIEVLLFVIPVQQCQRLVVAGAARCTEVCGAQRSHRVVLLILLLIGEPWPVLVTDAFRDAVEKSPVFVVDNQRAAPAKGQLAVRQPLFVPGFPLSLLGDADY